MNGIVFSTFRQLQSEFHHVPSYSTIDIPSISSPSTALDSLDSLDRDGNTAINRFAQPRSPHPRSCFAVLSDPSLVMSAYRDIGLPSEEDW